VLGFFKRKPKCLLKPRQGSGVIADECFGALGAINRDTLLSPISQFHCEDNDGISPGSIPGSSPFFPIVSVTTSRQPIEPMRQLTQPEV
jgi:hypothetical protein